MQLSGPRRGAHLEVTGEGSQQVQRRLLGVLPSLHAVRLRIARLVWALRFGLGLRGEEGGSEQVVAAAAAAAAPPHGPVGDLQPALLVLVKAGPAC